MSKLIKKDLNQNVQSTKNHKHTRNPFDIKVRRTGCASSVDSIIWPWVFSNLFKEYLNNHGRVVHFDAGDILDIQRHSTPLIVLIQGAISVDNTLSKHKHYISEFYFSGESFEYSHESAFDADIRYSIIQDSFIYIAPDKFGACSKQERFEFIRFLSEKRKQRIFNIHTHLATLATLNAKEKVAFLLVNLYQRLAHNKNIQLPMSRINISRYLSLTPETVSRELNSLQNLGYLKIHRTTIEFNDIAALTEIYYK